MLIVSQLTKKFPVFTRARLVGLKVCKVHVNLTQYLSKYIYFAMKRFLAYLSTTP